MQPPKEAHGLLCHYFHGEGFPPAQGSLSVDDFNRLLDAYGHRLVPAKEWITHLNGYWGVGDKVCVTFDDGLYEAHALALPVLEERGLTACWNVYTGPYVGVPNNLELYRWVRNHGFGGMEEFYRTAREVIGYKRRASSYLLDRGYLTEADRAFRRWRDAASARRYEDAMDRLVTKAGMDDVSRQWWMTPSQLRDLHRSGHVIGIHTHSHPVDMTLLSLEQTALEYATSRAVLGGALECDPKTLTTVSHPRGLAHPQAGEWLASNGFTLGWGATMQGTGPWMTPRWSTGYWTIP